MDVLRKSSGMVGRAAAIVVVAAAVFAGGLGIGSELLSTGAQTNGGQIRGCVNAYTGNLRILYGNGQCSTGERPLNWSQIPAGSVLDRKVVRNTARLVTGDAEAVLFGRVDCPDGYLVSTGGARPSFFTGDDEFYLMSSTPIVSISGEGAEGWLAEFKTVDGENAEGSYSFTIDAVRELRAS